MPNNDGSLTAEEILGEMLERYASADRNHPPVVSSHDLSAMSTILNVLKIRASEIDDLGKMADKLDKENGDLKRALAAADQLRQKNWEAVCAVTGERQKLLDTTTSHDQIHAVLNKFEFLINAAIDGDTYEGSLIRRVLNRALENVRDELLRDNSDIPF